MAKKIIEKHFNLSMFALGIILGTVFVFSDIVNAVTFSTVNPPILTGDITGAMLLDGTVTDADVSATADISGRKIKTSGTTATVLLTDGTRIATTTGLKFATSTADLYVLSGKIHASSTNFNSVNYTWPSADGAANNTLSTDGAGVLSWAAAASTKLSVTLTTDEAIVAGDAVSIASSTQILEIFNPRIVAYTGIDAMGNTSGRERIGQSFTADQAYTFAGIQVRLAKNGSPTDNTIVAIQADTAGAPSGTDLTSFTISNSTLTGTETQYIRFFATTTLSASTNYWVVFRRSGAVDAVNYPTIGYSTANTYTSGASYYYNGTTWGVNTGVDNPFVLLVTSTPGRVVRSSAALDDYTNGFIGFSNGTHATGTSATINIAGVAPGFSGLTIGGNYYLANATSTLGLTPGTFSRKACKALSATSCLINNSW